MRLSEWRGRASHKNAESARTAAVLDPVLEAFGAGPDPHCWVAWGEDPGARFTVLTPTDPGLISSFVRVVPGEGPRATTKLVRWNRVSIGELAVETQGGRRLLSFQIEGQVLRGVDADADMIAAFALRVIAAIDGRPLPPVEETSRRRSRTTAKGRPAKAAATASRTASTRAVATRPADSTSLTATKPAAGKKTSATASPNRKAPR